MIRLFVVALAIAFGGCTPSRAAKPVCPAVDALANTDRDAAVALAACLAALPPGATVALQPGRYRVSTPIRIVRPVTIRPAAPDGRPCGRGEAGCVVLLLSRMADKLGNNTAPITISADDVTLDRVVVLGTGSSGADFCDGPKRAAGGGLRADNSRFTFVGGAVRNVSCNSAMEITRTAKSPCVSHAWFGPNGDHRPGERWSDGVTLHDSADAVIEDNTFVDNTDVQLILGGCVRCVVRGNRIVHTGAFQGASFAALMLNAWPDTSGNYQGTVVSGNRIDCGAAKRCGYGIMIGGAPWAPTTHAAGGRVSGNRVANAQIGIDVDGLTGPMTITNNIVTASGGRYLSDCGTKAWPAINVAPGQAKFAVGLDTAPGSDLSTAGCLLNRKPA